MHENPRYRYRPEPPNALESPRKVLDNYIAELHLELGNAYVALSGVPYDGHDGDCCVKNAPHYKPEPCCCGAAERAKQPRG